MSNLTVKQFQVLVLGHPDYGEEIARLADTGASIAHVETLEAALHALRADPFDLIISDPATLLSFEQLHAATHTGPQLDGIVQGIGIVDEHGEYAWANAKMLEFSEELRVRVKDACADMLAAARAEGTIDRSAMRGGQFEYASEDGGYYIVTTTPILDVHGQGTRVAAVVRDATPSRRLQETIDAIDRAGRELVSLDAAQFSKMDAQERLDLLEDKIISSTRDLLHFEHFSIHILDRRTNKLDLLLASGMPDELNDVELSVSESGDSICGYVAAVGSSYVCSDVTHDPRYVQGIDNARSSLTVPLKLHDRIVGVFNFESTQAGAFGEDDRQFAEIFGRHVALSLHILELLVHEQSTTTGRVGGDVRAEITGPLNDILVGVELLSEDYANDDALRRRLKDIAENAERIREAVTEVTSANAGVVGAGRHAGTQRDPLLAGKRILVADDEETIRDTVRDVLASYGCTVSAVAEGASAVALLADHRFDLVLSDIKMPGKNGYEVFAAAKDANAATPVILMTGFGYDPNHSIVRARRDGLAAVLFKPFKVDQLLTELRMALKPADA